MKFWMSCVNSKQKSTFCNGLPDDVDICGGWFSFSPAAADVLQLHIAHQYNILSNNGL